jgi:hypothetical protein
MPSFHPRSSTQYFSTGHFTLIQGFIAGKKERRKERQTNRKKSEKKEIFRKRVKVVAAAKRHTVLSIHPRSSSIISHGVSILVDLFIAGEAGESCGSCKAAHSRSDR